ncbi:hypothetical protein ACQY0O_001227 [Thecaphora frezii]
MALSSSRLATRVATHPSLSSLHAARLAPRPSTLRPSSSSSSSSFSASTTAYRFSTFARSPLTKVTPSTLLSGPAPWRPAQPALRLAPLASARQLSLFNGSVPDSKPATAVAEEAKPEITQSPVETAEASVSQASEQVKQASEQVQQASGEAAQSFVDAAHNTVAEPAGTAATTLSSAAADAATSVDATAAATVSETVLSAGAAGVPVGELSSLGLAHWSSPPGWITHLLDFIGTHTGLPWWGTIVVTSVILRLALAPINIAGQKNAIRLGNISPRMKELMDNIKHCKAAGDQRGMQENVSAVQKLMRDNNTNPFKSLTPILFQFPLMFSFFLALERIAKSGSESFAHGGPFWTMDLSAPDPTYVLPLVSTAATFAVAELGFKLGTTGGAAQDPAQSKMMKYIFRAAMPVIGWFATTFPSGVLVYWATTNLWSLLQMLTLQIPLVRRLAKFPFRIQHPPNPYAPKEKSILEKFREARAQMNESAAPPSSRFGGSSPPSSTSTRLEAINEILGKDQAAKQEYERLTAEAAKQRSALESKAKRIARARAKRGQL